MLQHKYLKTEEYVNLQPYRCVFLPDPVSPVFDRVPIKAFLREASCFPLSAARCSLVTMAALSGPRASSCATESA